MGTYMWAAVIAVAVLAFVLGQGAWWRTPRTTVVLPADAPWTGVVLENAAASWELAPGGAQPLPAGVYQATFVHRDGRLVRRTLVVAGDGAQIVLSADLPDAAGGAR